MTRRADDVGQPQERQPQPGRLGQTLLLILSVIGVLAIVYGIGGPPVADAVIRLLGR